MKHRADTRQIIAESLILLVPKVLALLMLVAGGMLLVSVLAPINPQALPFIKRWFPLELVELSHAAGVVNGVLLIFVARGLWERIDTAWYMALGLLLAGAVVSLTREWAVGMAVFMIVCALILLPCKRAFARRSTLLSMNIKPLWLMIGAGVLICIAVGGFYAYETVPYAHDLWQDFAYEASVSRFLRGLAIIGLTVLMFALYRLFGIARAIPGLPDETDMADIRLVASVSSDPAVWLALTGDKHILWNEARTTFVMYGVSGRQWVVVGAPVGAVAEGERLCWRLREMASLAGARLSFYHIDASELPLMLDLGLRPYKIGEEALVDAQNFDLAGKKGYTFRQIWRKFEHVDFGVLSPDEVTAHMPRLKVISDGWLKEKSAKEKGFSMGFFDADYIKMTPVAVIRIDGEIMAFANLWPTVDKSVLGIDLMRYDPASPPSIMEYLFLRLIFHARDEGYRYFSLGMTPLGGFGGERGGKPVSTPWHRIASLVYTYGSEVYNFDGLRAYKEKFKPQWRPSYVAVRGSEAALMRALGAVVVLGSRGDPDRMDTRLLQNLNLQNLKAMAEGQALFRKPEA